MPRKRTEHPYQHRHYYANYYGPYYGQIKLSDEVIRDDVRRALVYDSWVDSNRINVEVHHGMVTLTGTVDSIGQKRAAGDDAWDTPGVLDVNNDISVVRK